jgi:CheY-like chemotaxis protein
MGILSGDNETVLVVDDTDEVRQLISMVLSWKGYRVVETSDGEEAVELASRVRPRLILMDLSMPVMDGYQAPRRIRGARETSHIPIIAVSAFRDTGNRQKAVEAGCAECIGKPVDFRALGSVIERHLQGH